MPESQARGTTNALYRARCVALAWVAAAASACGGDSREGTSTGASVEAKERPPALPATPAYFDGAFTGDLTAVETVLESGVDVDATDPQGNTALMLAAFNGHTELVRLLLARGARVDERDPTGRTALMFASSGPFPDTVGLLLENEASVNLTDSGEGWSAIMFAGGEGLDEVIQVLLSHGADANIRDDDGDTALTFAQRNGHRAAATRLAAAMKK